MVVNFGDRKKMSLNLNFRLKSLTESLKQMTGSDRLTVSVHRFAFSLAQTGPLKQVLAAMGINHTVMNPGWVTAHQRIHESLK